MRVRARVQLRRHGTRSKDASPQRRAWWGVLALPAALTCTAIVHWSALGTFFAADDITFLSRARGLEPTPWSFARPLSEGVAWRALHAGFGLDPFPYHLFILALHLGSTAMVFAIGRRLLAHAPLPGAPMGGRGVSAAAATLFGTSAVAFTPLHWTSSLVEVLVTFFALAGLLAYLVARERGSGPGLWLSAILGFAAMLSKENAILFPLALLVVDRRSGLFPPQARTLVPAMAASAAYAAAFVATIQRVRYVGSEAYQLSFAPGLLGANLATYVRWAATSWFPMGDVRALTDPGAWRVGAPIAASVAMALWLRRRAPRHPEEVGVAWFLVFLAPVLGLVRHTYQYFLYLPWAGACWLLAALALRPLARWPRAAGWSFAAVLLAWVVTSAWTIRERERALQGAFLADRIVRESQILRNAIAALDSARMAPGTRVIFVNSAPRPVPGAVSDPSQVVVSYLPFEAALRGGDAVRVFLPDLRFLGIGPRIAPEWEDAEAFLFSRDGELRRLGRGARALAGLGTFTLQTEQWAAADSMFRRSLALGDTLPDATFGLIYTSHHLGNFEESRAFEREFLRLWPDDPRAIELRDFRNSRRARGG